MKQWWNAKSFAVGEKPVLGPLCPLYIQNRPVLWKRLKAYKFRSTAA